MATSLRCRAVYRSAPAAAESAPPRAGRITIFTPASGRCRRHAWTTCHLQRPVRPVATVGTHGNHVKCFWCKRETRKPSTKQKQSEACDRDAAAKNNSSNGNNSSDNNNDNTSNDGNNIPRLPRSYPAGSHQETNRKKQARDKVEKQTKRSIEEIAHPSARISFQWKRSAKVVD